jgi:hypothetical protein
MTGEDSQVYLGKAEARLLVNGVQQWVIQVTYV